MKKFLAEHSYNIVKMFLNQFAIAIFGFSLVLASARAENVALRNVTSVFSILVYLFLLYTMTWEIGFRDRVPVEAGRKKRNPYLGLLISLCANAINFVLAILIALPFFFEIEAFSNLGGACASIAVVLEGMYMGLLANPLGGAPLNSYAWVYFLLPLPAMAISGLAYYLGLRDIKFTSLFDPVYPESDREPTKKGRSKKDD